ncbi:MAG: hypothetical protein PF541_12255 [Prolixibacteraceae bacterium]|jgi:hypothetical protein|nr:hypothetical protein [Prolixibacteraceae bacterium]
MKKPEIINYKGVDIIYLNFSNMRKVEEIIQLENEGAELIQKQKFNSAITLTNMDGMFFNNEIRNHFSKVVKDNTPFVKASAVTGLNGLISIMYKSFIKLTGRNINLFKTKDEALEFLAKNK